MSVSVICYRLLINFFLPELLRAVRAAVRCPVRREEDLRLRRERDRSLLLREAEEESPAPEAGTLIFLFYFIICVAIMFSVVYALCTGVWCHIVRILKVIIEFK